MIIAISGKINSGKDTIGDIIQYLYFIHATKSTMTIEDYFDSIITSGEEAFHIKKFADAIKDTVCLWLGCTREQLEDREFKNTELPEEWNKYAVQYINEKTPYTKWFGAIEEASYFIDQDAPYLHILRSDLKIVEQKMTPRLLLQLLGTECGRDIIHPNIWVNALMGGYRPLNEDKRASMGNVIDYSDCKFPKWIITDMRFPNELEAVKKRGGITIRVNRHKHCGSCETIFTKEQDCPNCGSGNWVYGHIDDHNSETALDDAEFDYTIDNSGTIEDLIEKVKKVLIKENIL